MTHDKLFALLKKRNIYVSFNEQGELLCTSPKAYKYLLQHPDMIDYIHDHLGLGEHSIYHEYSKSPFYKRAIIILLYFQFTENWLNSLPPTYWEDLLKREKKQMNLPEHEFWDWYLHKRPDTIEDKRLSFFEFWAERQGYFMDSSSPSHMLHVIITILSVM